MLRTQRVPTLWVQDGNVYRPERCDKWLHGRMGHVRWKVWVLSWGMQYSGRLTAANQVRC